MYVADQSFAGLSWFGKKSKVQCASFYCFIFSDSMTSL